MKKLLILLSLALWCSSPAVAQDEAVRIDWPPPVYDLAGVVSVTGSANPPDLLNYYLEAAEYNPADESAELLWLPASLPTSTPVENGVLAQWDTTLFPDGLYQLRLHVRLRSGESLFAVITPLRIANGIEREVPAAATPPPAATPTIEPTPLPPTPVPRPLVTNLLPIPVGGHVMQFSDKTVSAMQTAGMTWMKWQIPFIVGDDSLLNVALDRINFAHQNGFNVLLSIKGDKDELAELGEDYYPLYANFVGRIAAFGPGAIQVWNEQNLDREWPEGKIDPRAYVELLRQAYEAIKAVDPSIMVITGAPAPTGAEGVFGLGKVWNDDRYYLGMANAGAANYADCIGVHYNEGIVAPQQQGGDPRTPDYPTRYLPLMIQRAAFPFRGQDIPLCFSELGYLSPEGFDTPLPSNFAWAANTSVQEQANWLRDAINIAASTTGTRVALLIVWNVDFDVYTEDDPQGGYAIIRPDGTCPACEAIATLKRGA